MGLLGWVLVALLVAGPFVVVMAVVAWALCAAAKVADAELEAADRAGR